MNDDLSSEKAACLRHLFRDAVAFLQQSGNQQALADIERARTLVPRNAGEVEFMQEYAWMVFVSGMKMTVIGGKWSALTRAFRNWVPAAMFRHHEDCRTEALRVFNSPPKIDAVLGAASWLHATGWAQVRERLLEDIVTTPEGYHAASYACRHYLERLYANGHLRWLGTTIGDSCSRTWDSQRSRMTVGCELKQRRVGMSAMELELYSCPMTLAGGR